MIVKTQQEKGFKPVEITITLQTQNELTCFKDIITNHAAASLCNTEFSTKDNFKNSNRHVQFAKEFLTEISSELKQY